MSCQNRDHIHRHKLCHLARRVATSRCQRVRLSVKRTAWSSSTPGVSIGDPGNAVERLRFPLPVLTLTLKVSDRRLLLQQPLDEVARLLRGGPIASRDQLHGEGCVPASWVVRFAGRAQPRLRRDDGPLRNSLFRPQRLPNPKEPRPKKSDHRLRKLCEPRPGRWHGKPAAGPLALHDAPLPAVL